MGKKTFAIKVMFVFDCEFYIQADNISQTFPPKSGDLLYICI